MESFSQENSHSQSMKMIYICAPLRGDIEQNIEFVRQKAQEVFYQGDIPICPHLMFPPIADATNPEQDETARKMGLELIRHCDEMHVYGSEWTSGMWAEIKYAKQLGIPVIQEKALIQSAKKVQKQKNSQKKSERCKWKISRFPFGKSSAATH